LIVPKDEHMRKVWCILLLVLPLACNKDDDPDKFTSINGYWIVRTPDDATDVTFRINKDADSQYLIDNVIVRHAGTTYDSKPIDAEISVLSATAIESITLVNSSAQVPFFVIRFQEVTVNEAFTEMQINISSFNIDGVFRQFAPLTGTRK
jgi:hypothetical protein